MLQWKDRLRQLGYEVPPNDVFDEETETATAAYQHRLGLEADGIVGSKTLSKILRLPWVGR